MRWAERAVRLHVPASSANLGPGFDSFGLALGLHDEVSLSAARSGLEVAVEGECADDVPRDERHLVVRAARAAFEVLGGHPPGLRLRCRNTVPHGRGLGSSAAAIVAGVVGAKVLAERSEPGAGAALDGEALLRLAAGLEGHPDNVAAALLGGFTLAWTGSSGTHAVRLEPVVSAVALVPPGLVPTSVARSLLPDQVRHDDAAANGARCGLLVLAMTARPDLLFPATEDRLHQGYRAAAMPQTLSVVQRLRASGHAAVISGAGPTVLVLGDPAEIGSPPRAEVVADMISAAPGWAAWPLALDSRGARVVE